VRGISRDGASAIEEREARTVLDGVADLAEVAADGGFLSVAHSRDVDLDHLAGPVAPVSTASHRVHDERETAEPPVARAQRRRSANTDLVARDVIRMAGATVPIERHQHVRVHGAQQRDQLDRSAVNVAREGFRVPPLPVVATVDEATFTAEEEMIRHSQRGAGAAQLFLSQGPEWNIIPHAPSHEGIVRSAEFAERRGDDDRHRARLGDTRDRPAGEEALVVRVREQEDNDVSLGRFQQRVPRRTGPLRRL
jgi:hypothetical protein